MADVIKLSVFAVICCAITLTVRAYRPELAQQAAVAAGAMVLIYAMEKLGGIFGEIKTMLETYGVPSELLTVLIKLTGIVYLVQFAAAGAHPLKSLSNPPCGPSSAPFWQAGHSWA